MQLKKINEKNIQLINQFLKKYSIDRCQHDQLNLYLIALERRS